MPWNGTCRYSWQLGTFFNHGVWAFIQISFIAECCTVNVFPFFRIFQCTHTCNRFLSNISNWLEPILLVAPFFPRFFAFPSFICTPVREGMFTFVKTSKMRYVALRNSLCHLFTIRVNLIWFDLTVRVWVCNVCGIQFDNIEYVNVVHWMKWEQGLQNSSSINSNWQDSRTMR